MWELSDCESIPESHCRNPKISMPTLESHYDKALRVVRWMLCRPEMNRGAVPITVMAPAYNAPIRDSVLPLHHRPSHVPAATATRYEILRDGSNLESGHKSKGRICHCSTPADESAHVVPH
jgi:hypothetical protein